MINGLVNLAWLPGIADSIQQGTDIVIVLAILAGAFYCFARELLPVDLVGVLIILALVLTGILKINAALRGFGEPAVIAVGALFIVSEGLLRTGALGLLANQLETWARGSVARVKFFVLIIVAVSSAFLNNTPVVAMFIPVVLRISQRMGFNPSRLLMPLSFAAILGGTCTLIGTSTNIMVASIVESYGVTAPTMFEFAKLGVIFTAIGLVYLLVFSRHLLPDRQTITSMTADPSHRLKEYVTELAIRQGGELVGKTFTDTVLATTDGVRIIQIIRGESILWPPFTNLVLRSEDALVIAGKIQDLMVLQDQAGLATLDEILSPDQVEVSSKETQLAEILVQPNSIYVGKTLEEAQFRLHFKVNVLAIQRHGMHLRKKISQHPLRVGDLLLVQGVESDLHRIASEDGIVLMSDVENVLVRRNKAPIAIAILAGVILALSTNKLPMAAVALAGACAMILSGCLSAGRVYEAIHWRVLVLIAGTLALGRAMEDTGTADWIAQCLIDIFHFGGPKLMVVVTLILTALLTEAVSNTAVAAIMIPVAIQIAFQLEARLGIDVDPKPFIMAIAYGASCSFLTPIGYQTNTLVYGAGGYRFLDFFRLGAPLVVVIWTLGGILIPVFWPF